MKILLVEDDDRIADPLAEDLRHQSHAVDIADDGLAGWEFAIATNYDVILLDWMLPKLDGVQLCQRLRQSGCQAYILLLTAKDATGDKPAFLTNQLKKQFWRLKIDIFKNCYFFSM
jgi:two-component system, OmpR family, response regulator QseB